MNITTSSQVMPMVLISDGKLYGKNLELLGKEEAYLKKELAKAKIMDYSQVFLCFFDANRQLHVYPNVEKGKEFQKEVGLQ
jgi:uncharacterized membrane protein YcaP (DUF421 family)